ncbi:MFS transporter [Streptomyces sp. NPDC003697]
MTSVLTKVPPLTLDRAQLRVFWATFAGWGLDGCDYMLYTLALGAVSVAFGLNHEQAGLIGTVTLLFSAFGGIVAGTLSDRFGRVRILATAIFVYSLFTALSGIASSYPELLVYRAVEGLGFGGEWAVGAVLISEVIPAKKRGAVAGFIQGAWSFGWALAVLASVLILPNFGGLGWRMMFWIGLVPAPIVIYILRKVPESPVWLEARRTRKTRTPISLGLIFRRKFLRFTILATLLSIGMQSGYYAIFTWLPTYLSESRGLSAVGAAGYLVFVIAGSFLGYVSAGFANDRFGRKPTFAVFGVLSAVTVVVYAYAHIPSGVVIYVGFPLGFFGSGIISGFGPFLAELFPSEMRGAGQGFCYNVGRGVAALAPVAVGALAGSYGLGTGISVFAASAYGLFLIALVFLPETRGRELA